MAKLKILDLFSGIGGFSLGLQWTGHFEPIAFAEKDDYCRRVLRKHWPEIPQFEDIRDVTSDTLARRSIKQPDVITAGFPCQPFSVAGKQAGQNDDRYLWPQLIEVIGEIRPSYVLLENVPGIISIQRGDVFKQILADLTTCGYDAEWDVIPAAAVGAWHRRDRFWLIAYTEQPGSQGKAGRWNDSAGWQTFKPASIRQSIPHPYSVRHCQPEAEQKSGSDQKRYSAASEQGGATVFYETKPGGQDVPHTTRQGLQRGASVFGSIYPQLQTIERTHRNGGGIWAAEPGVGRVAHGVSSRVDRVRALGNAVVPQVVEYIGYQIARFENERRVLNDEVPLYQMLPSGQEN